jgi:GMP synthase (glutamine-hydrolysing)
MSTRRILEFEEMWFPADSSPTDSSSTPSHYGEAVVILDYGAQYARLIARRVRELGVYCELVPWDAPPERVLTLEPKGIILSGGPASVYEEGAPSLPGYVLEIGVPILGICYGMQLLAHHLGGGVGLSRRREFGPAKLTTDAPDDPLVVGLPSPMTVWMSHGDRIERLPPDFVSLAHTANSAIAVMGDGERRIYGVQFHPEVVHTPLGREVLANFLFRVCQLQGDWRPENFVPWTVENLRRRIGEGRVLCALSGGVDSAVTAALIHRAAGDHLTCIFVNHGFLRRGEPEQVVETFQRHMGMNLVAVNSTERFLERLRGVVDPEEKRRRIGEEFVRVFEEEAGELGRVDYLGQGTIYPDVIESGSSEEHPAARIKAHHNVAGLPVDMVLQLVEPLRYLFKDEVRAVGRELGLPEEIVGRHPFPGPGLAVRIVGEVTGERLETVRQADAIMIEEIGRAGLSGQIAQAFAVLTPLKSTGVMGDGRTYQDMVALRAVTTQDFMTADWARFPPEVLAHISNRIVNEVPGVNRVVYDITSKPPSTIEWE